MRYLKHTPKKNDQANFEVKEYPEIKRWYIHRKRCLNEYLWPDGTIHNFTCGTVKLGEEIKLKNWPGYFTTKTAAKVALVKYKKANHS